ncbi:hypothetical protein QBC39DRAFT_415582 [Podospora conica]|nr:hypothetical protein QBC39DRAFT_415582 [Schizothecium conicum]
MAPVPAQGADAATRVPLDRHAGALATGRPAGQRWEVEEILSHRTTEDAHRPLGYRIEFLVRWQGSDEFTEEDEASLQLDVPGLVGAYWASCGSARVDGHATAADAAGEELFCILAIRGHVFRGRRLMLMVEWLGLVPG